MADFTYERGGTVLICLRVPRDLWDRWEYRHQHFGQAIHVLRDSVVQTLAINVARRDWLDQPDPFYKPQS
jgi:hypothetical protein